jgi:hypothetical protein
MDTLCRIVLLVSICLGGILVVETLSYWPPYASFELKIVGGILVFNGITLMVCGLYGCVIMEGWLDKHK